MSNRFFAYRSLWLLGGLSTVWLRSDPAEASKDRLSEQVRNDQACRASHYGFSLSRAGQGRETRQLQWGTGFAIVRDANDGPKAGPQSVIKVGASQLVQAGGLLERIDRQAGQIVVPGQTPHGKPEQPRGNTPADHLLGGLTETYRRHGFELGHVPLERLWLFPVLGADLRTMTPEGSEYVEQLLRRVAEREATWGKFSETGLVIVDESDIPMPRSVGLVRRSTSDGSPTDAVFLIGGYALLDGNESRGIHVVPQLGD